MKNIGLGVCLLAMTMLLSCDKKQDKITEVNNTTETTVEKTVVVDTVVVKPETVPSGTSVKVGSNGVEVKSKDVQVEVK